MADLFAVLYAAAVIVTISDILRRFRGPVERLLWIVLVLAVPVIGMAVWYWVQWIEPRRRLLARRVR